MPPRAVLTHVARVLQPNEESICRGMKVAKEDVVAFVAALRALLAADSDDEDGGQMAGFTC